MALSHSAKIHSRSNINKSGLHEEESLKLDVVNLVHQEENIYLDVFFYNDSDRSVPATYRKTQNTPILDKPSNYKCFIKNFTINMSKLRMFANSSYDLTFALYYYPDNLISIRTPLKAVYPSDYLFYSEYEVLDNPDGINSNIITAFNDIVSQYETIHGLGSWIADGNPLNPPFVFYDTDSGFFKIYNDIDSSDANNNAVQFYVGPDFGNLISGLNLDNLSIDFYGTNSSTLYQQKFIRALFPISVANTNVVTINGNDYVVNIQCYRSLARWWELRTIYLSSNSIGTRSQYIAQSFQNTDTVYRNILLSLNVIQDSKSIDPDGGIFRYIPTGEYTDIDMLQDNPLKTLDFEVTYSDLFGNLITVPLSPKDSFSFTIVFTKSV